MADIKIAGIDTNIFMNILRKEKDYYESSFNLIKQVEEGEILGVISSLTIAEIAVLFFQKNK